MTRNRRLHAELSNGGEVVRYDRAGKWYVEYPDRPRRAVSVGAAARLVAQDAGAIVYHGLPGGGRFDAKMRGEG